MLGLTAETLASESKLPVSTIEALETDANSADAKALATVRSVLETRGVLFLASGGDGYSVLTQGTPVFDAGLDLDALEAWLATNPTVPAVGRILDATKP